MAVNPMQRKSRNSFLLGMFIMLLITGAVIALLFFQIMNLKKAENDKKKAIVSVFVLNKAVKSGDEITPADYTTKDIEITITKSELATISDLTAGDETKIVSKIALAAGTPLLKSMLTTNDAKLANSTRLQEYNMVSMPTTLEEGDCIDIRLMLPTGQDYIVVSKKKVVSATERVLQIELAEEEILTMSNAIVEAYIMTGSKLYATRYVEPGLQTVAVPTYPVSNDIGVLINQNPNVLETAKTELNNRYNQSQRTQVINGNLDSYTETRKDSVNSKVIEEITKALEDRTKYLQGLSAI